MSNDELMRSLGKLAREQQAAEPPRELLSPPSPAVKERIAARAIASLEAHARPARRPRWQFALAFGAPLALAASALLWVGRDAPLPQYAMVATGGMAELRGAPTQEALVLLPGAPVEVILRPAAAAEGDVSARLFWVRGDEARQWKVEPERSAAGSLRVRGAAEAPFGPGDGELVVVVGRQGDLPADGAAVRTPRAGWQVFRRAVRWQAGRP